VDIGSRTLLMYPWRGVLDVVGWQWAESLALRLRPQPKLNTQEKTSDRCSRAPFCSPFDISIVANNPP
jgi:hypothetical protein